MSKNKKLLSIVAPAYNEAENIDEFYSRILESTKDLNLDIEIIYVNDGSLDKTIDVIYKQKENIVLTIYKYRGHKLEKIQS